MATRGTSLLLIILLSAFAACLAQAPRIEGIQGAWEVADTLCSGCGQRPPGEKGAVIRLEKDRIVNPLYGSCDSEPSYQLLKKVRSKELVAGPAKRWPASAKKRLTATDSLLYGFVTCQGMNFMQMAFLSDSTALYVYEGGLVFLLNRPPRVPPTRK